MHWTSFWHWKVGVVACWRKNCDLSEKRPKKNEWDSIKLENNSTYTHIPSPAIQWWRESPQALQWQSVPHGDWLCFVWLFHCAQTTPAVRKIVCSRFLTIENVSKYYLWYECLQFSNYLSTFCLDAELTFLSHFKKHFQWQRRLANSKVTGRISS